MALPQMAPMEAFEGKNESKAEELPPVSPWDKIIVAFAGPLFSFGLAIFFAVIVWIIGRPVSEADTTTVVGVVVPGSPAQEAGILPGDKILRIDGYPVTRFSGIGDSIMWRVVSSAGDTLSHRGGAGWGSAPVGDGLHERADAGLAAGELSDDRHWSEEDGVGGSRCNRTARRRWRGSGGTT